MESGKSVLHSNPITDVDQDVATPWWVAVVVILSVFLMGLGAMLALVNPAMLVSPNAEINEAVRVYAGYLTARNGVLAIMLVALLTIRARRALGNLLAIGGLIQLFDLVLDSAGGRYPVAAVVLLLGILFLAASAKLCGAPFWSRSAWVAR